MSKHDKAVEQAGNSAKRETFFPGVRKPVQVEKVVPLKNAAGEKRIKLDLVISLADNQLLGIPEWLMDGIDLVQRAEGGWGMGKNLVEISGVILQCYTLFEDEAADRELTGVLLKGFQIRRSSSESPSGELAESELAFQAYTFFELSTWNWAGRAFQQGSVWVQFGTRQAKMSFGAAQPVPKDGKPAVAAAPAPSLFDPPRGSIAALEQRPDEDYADAAQRSASSEFDALFGGPGKSAAANDRDLPEADGITDDEDAGGDPYVHEEEDEVDTHTAPTLHEATAAVAEAGGPQLVKDVTKKPGRRGSRHVN